MSSAREIRLWEDGTWTPGGDHWIAVRREEWDEMLDVIASARSVERGHRLGTAATSKMALLGKRLRKMEDNIRAADRKAGAP